MKTFSALAIKYTIYIGFALCVAIVAGCIIEVIKSILG